MDTIEDVIKWYKLGVQLDFKNSRLEIIKADHPNDVEGAKMELVSEWLNNDPDKSWDKLASALRQIGHINLSDKISAYGRGMLFSIVLSCCNAYILDKCENEINPLPFAAYTFIIFTIQHGWETVAEMSACDQ